jgi:hypothetical protein
VSDQVYNFILIPKIDLSSMVPFKEGSKMKSKMIALLAMLGFALVLYAADKPWTEWTKKDAEKILTESNWAQVQTETDISEPMYSPASRPVEGVGALNQSTKLEYTICFLSARPIRHALLRLADLNPGKTTPAQLEKMREFVAGKEFEKVIVVAVDYASPDQRFFQTAHAQFSSAITSTLKNNTYLDIKGGKVPRVFLQEYKPKVPNENLGARFIFPRFIDDQPVIDANSSEIRFYAEFPRPSGNNRPVKLDMRFKVQKFMYEGKIEF